MSDSSGSRAKKPQEALQFVLEVRALPDGLTPSGCLRTMEASSNVESSLLAVVEEFVFSLFEGRDTFPAGDSGCIRVIVPFFLCVVSRYSKFEVAISSSPDFTGPPEGEHGGTGTLGSLKANPSGRCNWLESSEVHASSFRHSVTQPIQMNSYRLRR
jgi:hypothetical protein